MSARIRTHILGYSRIGNHRELKFALEDYWAGKISESSLVEKSKAIRAANWRSQRDAGIDLVPSNDFSLYDHVLDTIALVGAVPDRFQWDNKTVPLGTYFFMARGVKGDSSTAAVAALEMTKWFDTNYHYLVPEWNENQTFHLASTKPFDEYQEALALGIRTVPVLLGPLSLALLGKGRSEDKSRPFDPLSLVPRLLPVYSEVLKKFEELEAEWVQIDEPVLVLDLTDEQRNILVEAYTQLRSAAPKLKLLLATYFGELRENLKVVCELPVDGLQFDAVRGVNELDSLLEQLPSTMQLSLGLVDGRNIWKNDFTKSLGILKKALAVVGQNRLIVSPSCSFLHSPISLASETLLDPEIKEWLAFAEEKVLEVVQLSRLVLGKEDEYELEKNRASIASRHASERIHHDVIKEKLKEVTEDKLKRKSKFVVRRALQQERLKLPSFPTTTIGSFPQTPEIRSARLRFKKGILPQAEYEQFLEEQTRDVVLWQEQVGLDVLVHGEFERTDMVEYFGEQLEGFTITQNGWVQSYGSRCVKPPIIYGDVYRSHPMTVRWSQYSQSLTTKPVKGMITGPITILQWSFVRDDQPRRDTAQQIALALRDEVVDLEAAGLSVIQIDEPALREGLPLRKSDWNEYLRWAVDAFRLTSAGVRDDTQIHTHMCYCQFEDILTSIAEMDADVISIESARSKMELLSSFAKFRYPNDIGLGTWDIHSPRVPSTTEMTSLILAAAGVISKENLWVNPDCGLKTRNWKEVKPSIANLVEAAKQARRHVAGRGEH